MGCRSSFCRDLLLRRPHTMTESDVTAASSAASDDEASTGEPSFQPDILLRETQRGNRSVEYSIAGTPNGAPVLFFYPAGGNRRMLQSLHGHACAKRLKIVCVNRPGKGETSEGELDGPTGHLTTACEDAAFVLDELSWNRVSLLFMCAGTPFALGFATQNPHRITGKLMGVASWVSPADSGETKLLYRFGSCLPGWLVNPLAGGFFSSINTSI